MKRSMSVLLCFVLLLCLIPVSAQATDESRSYEFILTAEGKTELEVTKDQIITVSLVLNRTDSTDAAMMYGMQSEIWYDDTFFELVPDGTVTYNNVDDTDMARRTGGHAFYLTFVSFSGGVTWPARITAGSFQLRVIADSGVTSIIPQNCKVSTKDGRDSFASTENEVKVILSTECIVNFRSNGGTEVPSQTVQYGEKVQKPDDPTRENYEFNGWYSDLDQTKPWDFDHDTVRENMTLYAGWKEETEGVGDNETPGDSGELTRTEDEQGNSLPAYAWALIGAAALVLILLLVLLLGRKKRKRDQTEE